MVRLKSFSLVLFLPVFGLISTLMNNGARAQTTALPSIQDTLAQNVQAPDVSAFQLQEYLLKRIPPLPHPATAAQWTKKEQQLRSHILDDVAFHGWPKAWIDSPPKFEPMDVIKTPDGYSILKFRYEIVPGFQSTALLYKPDKIVGRVPAVLNLLGHEPEGISVEYEQKRCINFAKRGIIALNLEWFGFGELSQPDNAHDYAADLDLVGSNAFGLFYLAMRRGLDYLASLPQVDPTRIGVTGLSGGGWQTVMLGALDSRVAVSVEVAGIGSRKSNLTHPRDTYEIEEDAPDLMENETYPEFVAMHAPRPTMLIHNAVDSCCFRAPQVKPGIYDQVIPFFKLYGVPNNLAWHENFNPGVHNYQLDNRQHAYRFFTEHFNMPIADTEIFSDSEIRTPQQLAIGVPQDNLTVLGLARQFAKNIQHAPVPADDAQLSTWAASERKTLQSVVRYKPVSTVRALRMDNSSGYNFQTLSYRFDYSNGLTATGIWLKENAAPANQPVTIVMNDNGYKAAADEVYDRVARGEQVLAFDPIFIGPSAPGPDVSAWMVLLDSTGDRSLGIEAAQLVATADWLRSTTGQSKIRLETNGIRSQVIALVAAAIQPSAFSDLVVRSGMKSLAYLLNKPVPFRSAPELFCLDLYKAFDIDSLRALAFPVKINQVNLATHKAPAR